MGGERGRRRKRGGRNGKGEGSGYCAACGGRIPTGGFPNIVFNFVKAARDPETASPGAEDPGAGRAGEPSQSPPSLHNPRLRVGATCPRPAAVGPAREGSRAGAAGSALCAEIENHHHPGRTEASGAETQFGDTQSRQGRLRTPPHPGCSGGGHRLGVQSARLCAPGQGRAAGQPRAVRDSLQNRPPRHPPSPLRGPGLPVPLRSVLKHDARRPEPVS